MVERFIKVGHLRRYIREANHREESAATVDKTTAGVLASFKSRPTINYTLGGSLDDKYQLKHQQKKLLRVAMVKARVNAVHIRDSQKETKHIEDPISFPRVNMNRVIMPHHDALVLTLCINNFDVHRVLVDLGSKADLLSLPAFNQMKLSSQMLNLVERILPNFNDATTTTLGDITLPIQAGPVNHQVLFSIVKDLGPYNCIVGKAWLHLMKAIPSTYHQMVSYLTNAGQVDLLSKQLVARQCYQLSIWEQKEENGLDSLPFEDHIPA